MYVAVYGTLKEGYGNYLQYIPGSKPYHALFASLPYRMYESETYPIIIRSPETHPLFVEIYDVNAAVLRKLDDLEEPYGLHRETVFLREIDLVVEIFVYDEAQPPAGFTPVESGDWKG